MGIGRDLGQISGVGPMCNHRKADSVLREQGACINTDILFELQFEAVQSVVRRKDLAQDFDQAMARVQWT